MNTHILVVDDEPDICKLVQDTLEPEGFRVTSAGSGQEMRSALSHGSIDLVVLDLGLPDNDGFALTRELRKTSDIPIIILTGKGEEIDKVIGLELGADDYVVKPFRPREFLARARSVLRRAQAAHAAKASSEEALGNRPPVLTFDGWKLDLGSRELFAPAGESVHLTTIEFELLSVLAQAPSQVMSRTALLKSCAGREWSPEDRSVDIHIGRLRAKIEADPKNPQIIKTVRGVGYIFVSPVALAS